MQASLFFPLFFLSGIAGLIYESIWSHYLKLFLGHAAYAQTLVLAIYMGGMAIGAWLAGRKLDRTKHLLIRYALIEILLGLAALLFHNLFVWYQDFSYAAVLPRLGGATAVHLYKWLTCALIITPQSMLLGATFPYMAAGYLRRYPGSSGYKITALYFANTLGAAIGVLISGFFLMSVLGLKGTIITAGCIDIFVGVAVLMLCRLSSANETPVTKELEGPRSRASKNPSIRKEKRIRSLANPGAELRGMRSQRIQPVPSNLPATDQPAVLPHYKALLIISGVTAASSFMYEVGWIRMLSLVLGSSTHSFELMLSAFILGMALGSFFIRKRIDSIVNVPRVLVLAQFVMGAAAFCSLFTYSKMFHLMAFMMSGLARNDQGFFFFNLSCDLICMLVMLPSTICAGMVLPLIIHLFYRSGHGESAIGKIYGINTLGGIVGIIVSMWLLMPYTGVRFLIILGGTLDIALGLYVLFTFRETARSRLNIVLPMVGAMLLFLTVFLGKIDPALAASGVFRNGTLAKNITMLSHRDGRTATISLYKNYSNLVICTNGKPDAAINVAGGIGGDEYTMALTGVLPLAVANDGARAAVIGMGSGMTSHFLLYDTTLSGVDIVEIEPAMVDAARKIGQKTEKTFSDPRSHIYIDDAKSFFSTYGKTYDMIISEPSNPWVSGVSGLFSEEFFSRIKHHLSDNGILVQWFHRYESDLAIVASIVKALRLHFPHYCVYSAGSDFVLIAAKNDTVNIDFHRDLFAIGPLAQQLKAMGFVSMDDFSALRFSSEKLIGRLADQSTAPPNSDYRPYVDLNAVRYRFIDNNIPLIDTVTSCIVPVRKIIEGDTFPLSLRLRDSIPRLSNFSRIDEAKKIHREMTTGVPVSDSASWDIATSSLLFDYASLAPGKTSFDSYFGYIIELLEKTIPYLSTVEMREIWDIIERATAGMQLSDNDQLWMHYFRALCSYNRLTLNDLSLELLPSDGWINDDYVNRMLLTSLLASSSTAREKKEAEITFQRFRGKHSPGIVLDLVRQMCTTR